MTTTEILGYVGLAFIAISFFFANVTRLRLFNLIGAAIMTGYGFMIDSYPVAILNIIIVLVNLYYLNKLSLKVSRLDLLEASYQKHHAFDKFFKANEEDIKSYFPDYEPIKHPNAKILLIMKDFTLIGAFAYEVKGNQAIVLLDYVVQSARDNSSNDFIQRTKYPELKAKGVTQVVTKSSNPAHDQYLLANGYIKEDGCRFVKTIA